MLSLFGFYGLMTWAIAFFIMARGGSITEPTPWIAWLEAFVALSASVAIIIPALVKLVKALKKN